MRATIDTMSDIRIREMSKYDLTFAAQCTAAEGWVSEDLATLEGFFLKDPTGCLIAEDDGHPVGICIATRYDTRGFIGELIVRPEARGRGVGATLLNHAVQTLQKQGAETIFLDGVLKAVSLYERNGFRKLCRSWRFSGKLIGETNPRTRRMSVNDLDQVIALDCRYFGTDRGFFLRRRLELYPELSYVLLDHGLVTGYILGRRGSDWVSAGPWVTDETVDYSVELLKAFALEVKTESISIGILDTNQSARELVHFLGFTARSDSPWRMALGNASNPGASPRCFAIGSAAKG